MKQGALKKEITSLTMEILDTSWLDRVEKEDIQSFGIKDAKRIILDYISNREFRVAFEHLEYVISECNILLNKEQKEKILKLAAVLNT
ncbi:hypothetical protein RQM59_12100 [Flavobacteriaceae bacterium S356]|uniref:Uncharacterized protein n=1 Tax=Asprobacillus argus TaxID=3076534 RepID=A0ABU3LHD0_9FLAO|nr:hypothetical protein [Flavobacteriaceae bacterium S356]